MSDYSAKGYEALAKELFRLGVFSAGGPKEVQERIGLDTSEISRLGNDGIDRHVHFFRILEIDDAFGNEVLKKMCRRAGGEFVKDEDKATAKENITHASVAALEAGIEFHASVLEAGTDGQYSNNEKSLLEKKKNALIARVERVFNAVLGFRRA